MILKIFLLEYFINGRPPIPVVCFIFHNVLFTRRDQRIPNGFSIGGKSHSLTPSNPPTPPPKHLKAQRAVGSQTAARCFHFSFNSPKQSVGILLSLLSDVKTGSRLIWTRSQVCKLRSLGPFHISFPEIMKFQSTVSGRWKGI